MFKRLLKFFLKRAPAALLLEELNARPEVAIVEVIYVRDIERFYGANQYSREWPH